MQEYKNPNLGRLALLSGTIIWGSSFVILKNTLDVLPVMWILAIRFTGAALLLALIGLRELKKLDMHYIKYGLWLGIVIFAGYVFQTFGLEHTTPGKNAFLTSIYCVIVPFLWWLMDKKRPDKFHIIAALVCIVGMALVSLDGRLTLGLGEGLTMVGGFFYAIQIVLTTKAVANRSVMLVNITQFAVCAVLSWCAIPFAGGPFPAALPSGVWWTMAYLCVVCTGICFLLQAFGQKNTSPQSASIIMTTESVFGTIFSALFYNERFEPRVLCGFVLIFAAVLISETKLSFLRRKPKAAKECVPAEANKLAD